MQVIFAGKAHPQDEPGKHLIQRISRMGRDPRFMGRVVLLEDHIIPLYYDRDDRDVPLG